MKFLNDQKIDQQAAHGLLRLAFENRISLHGFEKAVLLKFQEMYEHAILRFYKTVNIKEAEIVPLLPPTCFLFTTPMLRTLYEGGHNLHQKIPPMFLAYLIEILAYSFTEDEEVFDEFLSAFR